ncbi:MAG: ribonuclease III [Lachnospiraceae bacterium]|nr:ribonuclease III [Lachnospiraceae bacterium]
MKMLEETIGYSFSDKELLLTAMTHTSFANEHRGQNVKHNERLEFLGDAVLEAVSSEFLYERYPTDSEGVLSTMRASMVCEPSLAICARKLGLPRFLRLGRGEDSSGGRDKDSVISDATEAVIGAIYLDGGFEKAKEFALTHILLVLKEDELYRDFKTELQEIIQNRGEFVTYVLVGEEGPDHDKRYTMEVQVNGQTLGRGKGKTKKMASKMAAREAMKNIDEIGIANVPEKD